MSIAEAILLPQVELSEFVRLLQTPKKIPKDRGECTATHLKLVQRVQTVAHMQCKSTCPKSLHITGAATHPTCGRPNRCGMHAQGQQSMQALLQTPYNAMQPFDQPASQPVTATLGVQLQLSPKLNSSLSEDTGKPGHVGSRQMTGSLGRGNNKSSQGPLAL